MNYDFTTILNRAGRDSLAADKIPFAGIEVDGDFTKIPMWIADMSFPTAPFIVDAIRKRLEMPNFGYFAPSKEYYDSIISWHAKRKDVHDIKVENIEYQNGVLGGVSSAIKAFSSPGDGILVHSPTYIGFTNTLNSLGRKIVRSELKQDDKGVWRMNFEDMDAKIKENKIHLVIFCSPHNPCGRVWERWEIEKALEVYSANNCIVISDEIWSDIIMPGYKHIPTQTISDDAKQRTVAFYAPSKTFSLAGLVGSYSIIYNGLLRDRVISVGNSTKYNDMNVLSMHALIAAFSTAGHEWADEMISVIEGNLNYACDFINSYFPGVSVMKPEGTYMIYLNCAEWCQTHNVNIHELQARGVRKGIIWQNGEDFCMENTIRMNLALPFQMEKEAFDRMKKYVFV